MRSSQKSIPMILHDPAPLGFKRPLARGEYTTANATSCGTASICNRVYGFGLPVDEPIVKNYSEHHANSKRSTTPSDETSTKPHHHQRPKRNAPRGSGCRPRWARSRGHGGPGAGGPGGASLVVMRLCPAHGTARRTRSQKGI